MKTHIFYFESKAPQFKYFKPFDGWQAEPPKEEKPKKEAETKSEVAATKDSIDYTLMPHKNPMRFTSGEIEAYKQMWANPHIPEEAKPPMPGGY